VRQSDQTVLVQKTNEQSANRPYANVTIQVDSHGDSVAALFVLKP